MKRIYLFLLFFLPSAISFAGSIEKLYSFSNPGLEVTSAYQRVVFENTQQSALPGEPSVPYRQVVLLLPPGESAESIEISGENEIVIPGFFKLYPKQPPRTTSDDSPGGFILNEAVYKHNGKYPAIPSGHLMTQYLNGYSIALCTFTPVLYNPLKGEVSYFSKVIVRIKTRKDPAAAHALLNLQHSGKVNECLNSIVQNPEMKQLYSLPKAPGTSYQYLIIAPSLFQGELQPLINMYNEKGISCQVKNTEDIDSTVTGMDLQEKIRSYIYDQYVNNQIEYVLLAGNPPLVPARGFYCYVQSGSGYTDNNIPADLYYSGMDGNYDTDGDHIYAEPDDNPDLLPEISVARFTVNTQAELQNMIHKSIFYQTNPVPGELNQILLAGEYLWASPLTFGGAYMDLLINDHSDNGYFTHGIPTPNHSIEKMYDSLTASSTVWQWNSTMMINKLNTGKSFIHHLGHANTGTMMRLSTAAITNENFSLVDGITHNYPVLYTQGCYDGAFDYPACVAVASVTLQNFLVAGIFNSRYGWFNEGTTDGPSEHLEREFVSALFNDTLPEKHIGTAHRISKIKTAPWVGLPGEYEAGAQRWVHYCCNVFGDPAMEIWTEEPALFTTLIWTGNIDTDWNKAGNWNLQAVPTTLNDVIIPDVPNKPTITTQNATFCHDVVIQPGGKIIIEEGKSMIVQGSMILQGEE